VSFRLGPCWVMGMGTVVTYAVNENVTEHESAARVAVAKSLAALKGFEFGGGYEPSLRRNTPLYFVPSETLSGNEAGRLGIRGANDLASRRNYDVLRGATRAAAGGVA